MKVKIKRGNRKSLSLSLTPEELLILLPNYVKNPEAYSKKIMSSFFSKTKGSSSKPITYKEFRKMLWFWSKKLNVKINRVQFRNMTKKWASCSENNNLCFHKSLFKMPKEFVEYVICHELVHMKVPNHSRLFRSLMATHMPDWERRVSKTMKHILVRNGYFSKPKITTIGSY
jgi:hypothetical protein